MAMASDTVEVSLLAASVSAAALPAQAAGTLPLHKLGAQNNFVGALDNQCSTPVGVPDCEVVDTSWDLL